MANMESYSYRTPSSTLGLDSFKHDSEEPLSPLDHLSHLYLELEDSDIPAFDQPIPAGSSDVHCRCTPKLQPGHLYLISSQAKSRKLSSFMDIPNELLIEILEEVEDDEFLYSLSLMCRRLHYIALPIYLARCGISDALNLSTKGEVVLFDYRRDDAVKGLRVALFITSIKSLTCTFQFPENRLAWELRNLHRLLGKLSHIEEVTFDFHGVPWELGATRNHRDLEWWKRSFAVILYDIIFAKSCPVFTIRRGNFSGASNWGPKGTLRRKIVTPFVIFKHSVISLAEKMSLGSSARNVQDLDTSSFHHSWFANAPFLAWIMKTLNASSITTLTIEDTDLLSEEWSHILSCFHLSALVKLCTNATTIIVADFVKFLVRHPLITHLRFSMSLLGLISESPLPTTALPNLEFLDAPAPYIASFLASEDCFPHLKSVAVSSIITHRFHFAIMDHTLMPVAYRLNKLRLSLHFHGQYLFNDDAGDEVEYCLHRITGVKLHAGWSWPQLELFATWLVPYPMLSRLTIYGNRHLRWTENGFLERLRHTSITTVDFNGEEHQINQHLLPK